MGQMVGGKVFEQERTYYLVLGVVLLLALIPLWSTRYPALHDYPNHLARTYILYHYDSNPVYRDLYELEWQFIPNLAMDLIVPAVMHFASIETASRIFLSIIIVLFGMGLHLLGSEIHGHPSWAAPIGMFLVYNFTFSYGFVNYMFGMGLFFITLAYWLRFRSSWTLLRSCWVAVLAVTCYVSHLSAFVFFAISVLSLTSLQVISVRGISKMNLIGFVPLVPASLAYASYLSTIEVKSQMVWWHPFLIKKGMGLAYLFLAYDVIIDGVLGLIFILLLFLSVKLNGARLVHREILLLGVIFVFLYVIAPMQGAQASYVDRRFVLPAAVFCLLALPINGSKLASRYLLIALLVLPVVRAGEVLFYWDRIGNEIQKQVRIFEKLPEGSRLYPMVVHDESSPVNWIWNMHFFYVAHYATIYRGAFVPTIYAWKTQNVLHLRSPKTGYVQTERDAGLNQIDWNLIFSGYDFLYVSNVSEDFKQFLLATGDLVAQTNETMLIRTKTNRSDKFSS